MEKTRVLVVDDDVDILTAAAAYLELDGFQVITATSGAQAIEKFETERPDVVILDLRLQDMHGFEICRQIRRIDNEVAPIPVIFLSACGDSDVRQQAMRDENAECFVVKPPDWDVLVAQIHAMARIRQREKLLVSRASHDVLTKLPNQELLRERLRQEHNRAVRNGTCIACMMIDVDRFKLVNDTWGHPAGDVVLREVSTRLRLALRQQDHLGRYGGEEFTAIVPETDHRHALEVAERLRRTVAAEPFEIPGLDQPLRVTVSIGVAARLASEISPEELIHQADQALLMAKRLDRNRVCSYQELERINDSAQKSPRL